jgi:hypothetical protein
MNASGVHTNPWPDLTEEAAETLSQRKDTRQP